MTIKPALKLGFSDFWWGLDPENNFFTDLFRMRFAVTIDPNPDLLICSVFGDQWRNFHGRRLFYTGEFIPPEPTFFDFSLSFSPRSETNYYLPLYRIYGDYERLFRPRIITEDTWAKKKAIGTIFSNRACSFRNWAFHRFNADLGVGSGGKAFNNVGGPVPHKRAFLEDYRFSLAFENTRWAGYATEKLIEAYASETVPIYWGDPQVGQVFNQRAFLTLNGKSDYDETRSRVRRGLEDFEIYRRMYEAPLFADNLEPEFLRLESIADFLELVVASPQRTRRTKRVSDLALYHWRTWWRFREWGQSRLFWIHFLQAFFWLGYLTQGLMNRVKLWVRGRKAS